VYTNYSTTSPKIIPPIFPPANSQAQGGQAAPSGEKSGQLGIYTDTVVGLDKTARKQDRLDAVKELLPDEKRLQACLAIRVDAAKPVAVEYASNADRARLTNVCRCDNPHLCPNCGPIIAEIKARMLREDLHVWNFAGNTSAFVVFTVQHFKHESLADVDGRVDKALARMFDSKPGRRFKAKWFITGRQRSPDVTWGANGWHSHRNFIFYLERRPLSQAESVEFESELTELWPAAVARVGGYADPIHGVKVKTGDIFDVADYISSKAMGCGGGGQAQATAGSQAQGWGQPEELTKGHLKQSRSIGLTPTGLIDAYLWGDNPLVDRPTAGRLWQEYAAVFKGKKFVDTSAGLRERLDGLKEQYQAELLAAMGEDVKPEYSPVCYLGPAAWRELVRLAMVLWLIDEVKGAQGDVYKVKEFLDDSGITDVYYPAINQQLPAWWYGDEVTESQAQAIAQVDQVIQDFNEGRV